MLIRNDEDFMRMALRQAELAAEAGEVPVGAVAVHDNSVLCKACNQVEMLKDATAHAEMIALTQAESSLGDWRLNEVTLYVTKEPCVMCAGAIVNCRVGRLVFGCPDPRAGAAGSVFTITDHPGMLHTVEVKSGVLAEESLYIIQEFFRKRRLEQKETKHG